MRKLVNLLHLYCNVINLSSVTQSIKWSWALRLTQIFDKGCCPLDRWDKLRRKRRGNRQDLAMERGWKDRRGRERGGQM